MSVSSLIESALEEAGTIIAVILRPELGPGAVIQHANGAFAALMRRPRASIEGIPFGEITSAIADPEGAAFLLRALRSGTPVQLDLPIMVGDARRWLGLRLTFPALPAVTQHAVITGRDITAQRRAATQEENFRRLMAGIFLRIDAPVAIVTSAGEISMANPAFHKLLGFSADELQGMRVDELTPPAHTDAMRAARAKQLEDGERYEIAFETLVKSGGRVPVRLTSILLRDGEQRMRVVTLIPCGTEIEPAEPAEPVPSLPTRNVGDLQALSLAAFRDVFGADWERMSTRAMLRAEGIIRRRLARDDLVTRSDDHSFIIWFSSGDENRNEALLAALVREIRLKFLTEFGEQAAAHVTAAMVTTTEPPPETFDLGNPPPTSSTPNTVASWDSIAPATQPRRRAR